MAPVYVREQGAVVRRQGERLLVTRQKERLLDLPMLHVDQLVLFGNVQLTSQAMAILLQKEIDVVFLSQYGKFRGRLIHTGSKFAQLRHTQLKQLSNDDFMLGITRQVVLGKLHNQSKVLDLKMATTPSPLKLQKAMNIIKQLRQRAAKVGSVDSLRGYEGSGAAAYWQAFKTLLPNDFGFQGRKYFPPPDAINGLLSFGYSLLLKDVTAAVQLVGLDPYLGFFHTIDYGRPSLALDMMEEFRPVVVDWVVIELVQAGELTTASFEETGNPKQPVRLKETIMTGLIQRYEQRLNQKLFHPDAGGKTSRRRVIELQVRRLAWLIRGQGKVYRPYLLKEEEG